MLTQRWKGRRTPLADDKALSREAYVTLFIHACYQFGASMSGVFLSLYLWRLTKDLWVNGLYSGIGFLLTPIGFAVAGAIAKRRDRLFVYRTGILLTALFFLLVIFARERVAAYFPLFAFFSGVSGAFYWLGYLTLMYDVSTDSNRIRYLGLNSIFFNLAGLAGPAIAGYIISLNEGLQGYTIVFSLAFVMFVVAAAGSLRIKTRLSHHRAYYLKYMGLVMKKNLAFNKGLIGWFVIGILQGVMLFLPNLLLYTVFTRENLVGYIGASLLLLTVLSSFIIGKWGRPHLAKTYILIAATGYLAAAQWLLWGIRPWTVVLFLAIYYFSSPWQFNSFSAYHYRIVGRLPLKGNLRVETMVLRETAINFGRVISVMGVILLAEELTGPLLPWVVLAAALAQWAFLWLVNSKEG
jgi:MFS transporter, YQGE family, putative transporter